MKSILSITLFCLLSVLVAAQNGAFFTIGTTGSINLKITLNGKNYSLFDKFVTFQNIQVGTYPIVIYQAQYEGAAGFVYKKVYEGDLTLSAGKHLELVVLRYGKVVWNEGELGKDDWANQWFNPGSGTDFGNAGMAGTATVMSDENFTFLKNILARESSDYRRLEIAPKYLNKNLFTARQIATLCEAYSSDYIRLDFAKLAYPFCYDKGSYFVVAATFSSTYMRDDLMQFVGRQK